MLSPQEKQIVPIFERFLESRAARYLLSSVGLALAAVLTGAAFFLWVVIAMGVLEPILPKELFNQIELKWVVAGCGAAGAIYVFVSTTIGRLHFKPQDKLRELKSHPLFTRIRLVVAAISWGFLGAAGAFCTFVFLSIVSCIILPRNWVPGVSDAAGGVLVIAIMCIGFAFGFWSRFTGKTQKKSPPAPAKLKVQIKDSGDKEIFACEVDPQDLAAVETFFSLVTRGVHADQPGPK